MAEDLDYAVARALGCEIVPADGADGRTYIVGVTYLFEHNGCLWTEPDTDRADKFSPSTDERDAIAALEAWCEANDDVRWGLLGKARYYHAYIQFRDRRVEMIGETKEGVICSTILLAASERAAT